MSFIAAKPNGLSNVISAIGSPRHDPISRKCVFPKTNDFILVSGGDFRGSKGPKWQRSLILSRAVAILAQGVVSRVSNRWGHFRSCFIRLLTIDNILALVIQR